MFQNRKRYGVLRRYTDLYQSTYNNTVKFQNRKRYGVLRRYYAIMNAIEHQISFKTASGMESYAGDEKIYANHEITFHSFKTASGMESYAG